MTTPSDALTLDPAPEAFAEIGVSPYLVISESQEIEIQKHWVKLTRAFHPDLLPYDAEDSLREAAEARLSSLNAAYNCQRSLSDRVDLLLESLKSQKPELMGSSQVQKLPPQYAIQYFELQEALEENPSSPETLKELSSFQSELAELAAQLEAQILAIAHKYPFEGFNVRKTWTFAKNDLEDLAKLRGQQKYVERLTADLERFLQGVNSADSN